MTRLAPRVEGEVLMDNWQIVRLRVEDGKLLADMAHGDTHVLDLGLLTVTAAVQHKGYVVATDGRRVIRSDGQTIEDITDRFVQS